jgi:hypothetical protein
MTNSTVAPLVRPGAFSDPLTEVLRSGAQRLLAHAVEAEVRGFIDAHAGERLEDGRYCRARPVGFPGFPTNYSEPWLPHCAAIRCAKRVTSPFLLF